MPVSVSPALRMELAMELGAQHIIYSTSPKWRKGKGPQVGSQLSVQEGRWSQAVSGGASLLPNTDIRSLSLH